MANAEITKYIADLNSIYQTGKATEHSYRPALLRLLEDTVNAQDSRVRKGLLFTNEPKRIDCGAPDYIATRNGIPIGYIEAKDIGIDLNGKANRVQFDRYKQSLDNIIFTDYIDFHLYIKGKFIDSARIAEIKGNKISPISANFEKIKQVIKDFGNSHHQGITSPADLAKMMACKASLMAGVIEKILEANDDNTLAEQMSAFKEVLIQDIAPKDFADVYAQTIAYGLFAARLHDESPDTFCRQKAASLIPKTNPFLRQLFQNIAGFDLDERICWIVDDLADTFRAANMYILKKDLGEHTQKNDPMIHFYEDFLTAYDPDLRKKRGVWYTPQAIVTFIVRAVDEILQKEFKLTMGLADTSKTKIKVVTQTDTTDTTEIEVHRVQILDPATGTGTFLAETVSQIHEKFSGQSGMWQSYVKEHLIPRLNGFELLMASYTMAHIKLEQLLAQTGYDATDNQRLRVYLTNSLEEFHTETGTPFAQFLAREANEANSIKRDTPVMVVMGNPPYSGISSNKCLFTHEIDEYKYVNGEHFNERKHWLNDDYVKFIRLGQKFVDKNNTGILAYINNHSFIDNPTFRGMRWNLMKSFDKIYIIDLHGNSKKKEVCPNGSKDENVFDIQQGVSINIFVKTGRKAKGALAEVYHFDCYGKRKEKYNYLFNSKFSAIPFVRVAPAAPFYFLMPKDDGNRREYEQGFRIDELMPVNVTGVQTSRDALVVDENKQELLSRIKIFTDITKSDEKIREIFFGNKKVGNYLPGDSRGWSLPKARNTIRDFNHNNHIRQIAYRPLDNRYIYYHNAMIDWSRDKVMANMLHNNFSIVIGRQGQVVGNMPWNLAFISNNITDLNLFYRGGGMAFPLYLYHDQVSLLQMHRIPNLAQEVLGKISTAIKLEFESEKNDNSKNFAPIDVLDYIYAVLHSPSYREKYKEFLKTDFPRIPYPETAKQFRKLAKLGEKLRRLHLLVDVAPKQGVADYPIAGTDEIDKPDYDYKNNRVYINCAQYFDKVPPEVWDFYIGGYRPAEKWLKDRKGRKLEYEDIVHYRKIVLVLRETGRVMGEIGEGGR